nr:MAG TPA: hypothetical protein [Caudoviricetes sp.]
MRSMVLYDINFFIYTLFFCNYTQFIFDTKTTS